MMKNLILLFSVFVCAQSFAQEKKQIPSLSTSSQKEAPIKKEAKPMESKPMTGAERNALAKEQKALTPKKEN